MIFSLFSTEIGLVILALGVLVTDLFMKDSRERGRLLADVAMSGVAILFFHLIFRFGVFGKALNGSFAQDGLAGYFKILFLLAAFFTLFMARQYRSRLKKGHEEFILLILFGLIGMTFVASANDFLLFFVALETLNVSLYVMTAYLKDKTASIEASIKYIILGALSTAVFLYGLSFIYGATGSTSYDGIRLRLTLMPEIPKSFIFGMALMIVSLCFKISAVPFQLWAPDVYEGAPTPVTAYLAIGSKVAGFAALLRLLWTVFTPTREILALLLAVLAALTIIYGNLGAIPQTNLKRLLGYSSIGHAGYLLIGLAAFSVSGSQAVLFYLMSYIFSAAGVFLVLTTLSRHSKNDEISSLAGLGRKSPVLAAGMLLSLLSLAGAPPLGGFFAKFYILWSGVEAGLLWLVVIGVLNIITSLYYYLKIVKAMYLEKCSDESPYSVTPTEKAFQYFSIAGILILGIFQGPFVRLAETALQNLVR